MSNSQLVQCKRVKKNGDRCGRWASVGKKVCSSHGAGTKKRVEDGTRQMTGRPIVTGRYADKLRHPAIAALIEQFEQDPDPMNLFSELAASRALFIDYVNRYESYTEALLAWHESWTAPQALTEEDIETLRTTIAIAEEDGASSDLIKEVGKVMGKLTAVPIVQRPRQVLDVSDSYRILSETTKIAERIKKMEFIDAIAKRDLGRIMQEMAKVLVAVTGKYIPEQATNAAFQEEVSNGWKEIRV
jgi:hypothetical protein